MLRQPWLNSSAGWPNAQPERGRPAGPPSGCAWPPRWECVGPVGGLKDGCQSSPAGEGWNRGSVVAQWAQRRRGGQECPRSDAGMDKAIGGRTPRPGPEAPATGRPGGLPHTRDPCDCGVEQVSDLLVPGVSDSNAGPEAPATGRPGGLAHARDGCVCRVEQVFGVLVSGVCHRAGVEIVSWCRLVVGACRGSALTVAGAPSNLSSLMSS
jgi:hypothetical protein